MQNKNKRVESNIYFLKTKIHSRKAKVYFKYTTRNNRIYNREKIMIIVNYVNLNSSTYLKGEKLKSSNLTTPKLLRSVCHLGIIYLF